MRAFLVDALRIKTFGTTESVGPTDKFGNARFNEGTQSVPEVSCPPYFTGFLSHPDDCKKFLQCAHGVTYVTDCAPGTVFNPAISVCDWPHSVPGCGEGYFFSVQSF